MCRPHEAELETRVRIAAFALSNGYVAAALDVAKDDGNETGDGIEGFPTSRDGRPRRFYLQDTDGAAPTNERLDEQLRAGSVLQGDEDGFLRPKHRAA